MVSLNWYQKQELEVAKWQWRRGCTRNTRDKNFFCWVELGTAKELGCVKIPCKKRLGGSRVGLLWENGAVACKSNCLEWWLGQCLKSLLWRAAAARHQKRTWVQKGTSTALAGDRKANFGKAKLFLLLQIEKNREERTPAPLFCSWFSTKDWWVRWERQWEFCAGFYSSPAFLQLFLEVLPLQMSWVPAEQGLLDTAASLCAVTWWACPGAKGRTSAPSTTRAPSQVGSSFFFGKCGVSAAVELSQESLWDKGNTRRVFEVGKAEPSGLKWVIIVKCFFFFFFPLWTAPCWDPWLTSPALPTLCVATQLMQSPSELSWA